MIRRVVIVYIRDEITKIYRSLNKMFAEDIRVPRPSKISKFQRISDSKSCEGICDHSQVFGTASFRWTMRVQREQDQLTKIYGSW